MFMITGGIRGSFPEQNIWNQVIIYLQNASVSKSVIWLQLMKLLQSGASPKEIFRYLNCTIFRSYHSFLVSEQYLCWIYTNTDILSFQYIIYTYSVQYGSKPLSFVCHGVWIDVDLHPSTHMFCCLIYTSAPQVKAHILTWVSYAVRGNWKVLSIPCGSLKRVGI